MNYPRYEAARYAPNAEETVAQGEADLTGIASYIDEVPRVASILDAGCGCGNLVAALRRGGYVNVKGIDTSPELVEYGRRLLGVDISVCDWQSYVEQSGELFDVIIALDVLEHLTPEECSSVLQATRSRLQSHGRLIIRTPNALCPLVLPIFHGDITHRLLVSPDLLRHLLRGAGFSGHIVFRECYPHHPLKRIIWMIIHNLIVKPAFAAVYYHFYQRLPRVITRNMHCCAFADAYSKRVKPKLNG